VELDSSSFGIESREAAKSSLAEAKSMEEMAGYGKKISAAGIVLDKYLSNIKDAHDLDKAKNFINQRALEYWQSAQTLENPDEWLPKFRESMGSSKEEVRKNLSPQAAAHLDQHITTVMPSYEKSIVQGARKFKISSFHGDLPASLESAAKTIVDAPDEIIAANAEAGFKSLVRMGANPEYGWLTPAQAAAWEAKLDVAVKTGKINKAMLADAPGTLAALKEPGAFGLDDTQRAAVMPGVTAQVHRVQNENYSRYMQNIFGATADNPVPGAVMPTEEEILPQIGKTLNVAGAQNILAYLRGQKASQGTGKNYKTDPQSYKEAATRLTDPDNPLTREEFLKNVESGEWRFDAKTYGVFLGNINARGGKLDKAVDSAIKSRIGFWKTQFGLDPKGDQIMTALGQLQAAKDAGELGKTPEEINRAVDSIFKPHHDLYMQEWSMGTKKPAQAKRGIISRIGGIFGAQAGPALPSAPGSIRNDKGWMSNDIRGSK
jgi:hypothetical protein